MKTDELAPPLGGAELRTGALKPLSAPARRWGVVAAASAALGLLIALASYHGANWRAPALAVVGGGLGFVLFSTNFGFAGSFRAAIERGDFTGFRAQLLAIALASIVFFPLLAQGELFGMPLTGFVTPVGVSFVLGSLMFGVGMQIGGGCASGTLFALGGGNARLLLTLSFFVIGSALGAAHVGFWRGLPVIPTGSSQDLFGWPAALALHLAIFAILRKRLPRAAPDPASTAGPDRGLVLARGAVGLAALNAATLVLSGHPWGETTGFTLWGSKIAQAIGFAPATWTYWQGGAGALDASIFADTTSVMDFAIIAGAMLAAGRNGGFALRVDRDWRLWAGAAAGGLLMGYGARLSDGCNIGAYFSAMVSGSLSSWVWVAGAMVGSVLGLRARRVMGLP